MAALLCAFAAGAAPPDADARKAANARILHAVQGDDVLGLVTEVGAEAELRQDNAGDPLVSARHEGAPFLVLFYDCEGQTRCAALQFRGYVPAGPSQGAAVALARVDAWNRTRRLGRAYLDVDGDPTIEHYVRLHGGVTPEHLRAERDWFLESYAAFRDVFLRPPAPPPVAPPGGK